MANSSLQRPCFSGARLLVLLGALASVGGVHIAQAEGQEVGWKEGLPAPPLRLPTIDGAETIDLYSLRGQPVLLLEFASW